MSTPYVPGPAQWYVTTGESGAWEFLGQTTGDTHVGLSPAWENVMVDGAGSVSPFDKNFQGASGSVSGDLIYFNQAVLSKLENWLNIAGSTPGTFPNGTIGTLARTEDAEFSLCILSPYFSTKQVYSGAGAQPCFAFPFAVPVGNWDVSRSTKAAVQGVMFECVTVSDLLGGGTLYTTVAPTGLPNPT